MEGECLPEGHDFTSKKSLHRPRADYLSTPAVFLSRFVLSLPALLC